FCLGGDWLFFKSQVSVARKFAADCHALRQGGLGWTRNNPIVGALAVATAAAALYLGRSWLAGGRRLLARPPAVCCLVFLAQLGCLLAYELYGGTPLQLPIYAPCVLPVLFIGLM